MRGWCLGLAVVVVVGCMGGVPPSALAEPVDPATHRLMVKLKPGAGEAPGSTARQARLGRLARAAGFPGTLPWRGLHGDWARAELPSGLDAEAFRKVRERLMATGSVAWVQMDHLARPHAAGVIPNDTYYGGAGGASPDEQWWIRGRQALGPSGAVLFQRRGVPDFERAREAFPPRVAGPGAVVVAVLDTGIRTHEDLASAMSLVPGHDFLLAGVGEPPDRDAQPGRDADPTDPGDGVTAVQARQPSYLNLRCGAHPDSWHGLSIAGMLVAQTDNARGVAGIHPGARVLPLRVSGPCGAAQSDIIAAMLWAVGERVDGVPTVNANPARVVNISFGGAGACDPAYLDAVALLRRKNVLVVASAGNEHGAVSRPANCPGVIGVAGANAEGYKTTYSNFGPELSLITVSGDPDGRLTDDAGAWGSALGDGGILALTDASAAASGPPYAFVFGTSFSAPMVAGVIGLMLDRNPSLTADQVVSGLRASARPHVVSGLVRACAAGNPGRCICTAQTCGAGLLDAFEALRFADRPDAYAAPVRSAENIDTPDVAWAVNQSAQDRPANAGPSGTPGTGGASPMGSGGGGAVDAVSGWALLGWGTAWAWGLPAWRRLRGVMCRSRSRGVSV